MISQETVFPLVRILESTSRDAALRTLVEAITARSGGDSERILEAVLEREAALSSRVSDRIAMPHTLWPEFGETVSAFGICEDGIEWDGRGDPIRLVVLLVGPEERHLQTMASVSRLLQAPGVVDAIVGCKTEEGVRTLLSGEARVAAPIAARTLAVTAATVNHAVELARTLPDNPVVVATSNPGIRRFLGPLGEQPLARRTFLVGPGLSAASPGCTSQRPEDEQGEQGITIVTTDRFPEDRYGPASLTLLPLLTSGAIHANSEVILVSGRSDHGGLDAVRLVDVSRELQVPERLADSHLPDGVRLEVVIRALHLAAELGSQGREGKPVGTIIVIGDDPRLERFTQQMILNPFAGYTATDRNILDPGLRETIKELAKIDGAFIVAGDGTLRSAGTHLAGRPDPREMEGGLGARHAAALGITASADVLALCLSESTGTITLFSRGRRLIRR